ncbi:MAG: Gfo/Idh/MocA family oxidoreductase [Candidatus Omnitrophica bacterium]|nr:Gfo/Idh/MocA family oxidoreductase [Candidatus Omnitrophota bacterium]
MRAYRAAIVGCGLAGGLHAAAYAGCPRTELVALADLNPTALAQAAERWRVHQRYPSLEALLAHETVDILSVCTPSNAHAEAVRTAAAAGVRAIWCEKPMTVTLHEAEELLALEDKPIIAVNHIRRWDRAYELARSVIDDGRLGRLIGVSAWYSHGVSNIGSHLFDTLGFLLGGAEWVWAAPDDSGDADPTLSGMIGWEGGVCSQLLGCGRALLLYEIDVVGTDARLRVSENGSRVDVRTAGPSPRYAGYRELGAPVRLWDGEDSRRMITAVEDLVRCLDEGGTPRCSGREGFKAVELVAAFLRSSATGQRVELPLSVEDRHLAIPIR